MPAAGAAAALVAAPPAAGCPFCAGPDRDGNNPARAELFGPRLGPNALAAAAPFAVLLAAAAAVRFGPWGRPRR